MQGADRGGDEEGHDDGRGPRPVGALLDQLGHDNAPQAGNEARREVDLAQQEDEDLGHGQQHVHGALDEEVHQVAGREEVRVQRLEEDGDDQEAADDGQDPGVAGAHPRHPRPHVLAERLGHELGGNGHGRRVVAALLELLDGADLGIVSSRHDRPSASCGWTCLW